MCALVIAAFVSAISGHSGTTIFHIATQHQPRSMPAADKKLLVSIRLRNEAKGLGHSGHENLLTQKLEPTLRSADGFTCRHRGPPWALGAQDTRALPRLGAVLSFYPPPLINRPREHAATCAVPLYSNTFHSLIRASPDPRSTCRPPPVPQSTTTTTLAFARARPLPWLNPHSHMPFAHAPAGSFFRGFRTPAHVTRQLVAAGVRNPSRKQTDGFG
jgi:hypothetical protein